MQLNTSFLCECVPWKIEYLKAAFPNVKAIFNDMRDLPRGKGHDALTGKTLDVPEVNQFRLSYDFIFLVDDHFQRLFVAWPNEHTSLRADVLQGTWSPWRLPLLFHFGAELSPEVFP